VIIAAVIAAAAFAPQLAPYNPVKQNYAAAVQPPTATVASNANAKVRLHPRLIGSP